MKIVSGSFSIYSGRNYHLRNKWDIFLVLEQGMLKYSTDSTPPSHTNPTVMRPQQVHITLNSKRLTDEANKTNTHKLRLVPAASTHWFGRMNDLNPQMLFEVIQGYSKWLSGFWQLVIHNTLEIGVYVFFLFNRTTLQVFVTYLIGAPLIWTDNPQTLFEVIQGYSKWLSGF